MKFTPKLWRKCHTFINFRPTSINKSFNFLVGKYTFSPSYSKLRNMIILCIGDYKILSPLRSNYNKICIHGSKFRSKMSELLKPLYLYQCTKAVESCNQIFQKDKG